MFNSVVFLSLIMVGVKAVGLIREVVLADYFGISVSYESVFIAMLFVGAPLSVIFVPLQTSVINRYVGFKNPNFIAAYNSNLLISIFIYSGFILAIWSLLMVSFSTYMFENPDTIIEYTPYLFVYVWLSAVNVFLYGVQQSRRHFMMTGFLPIANHVLVLFAYFAMFIIGIPFTVNMILFCMVASVFFEFFILYRYERFDFKKFNLKKSFFLFKSLIYRSRYLVYTSVLATLMPILEQRISSSFLPGGALIIKYASMFPLAISSVVVTSLSVIILPYFSKLKNDRGVSECINKFILYAVYFSILSLIAAIFGSILIPIVVDVFFHNSLSDKDVGLVKNVSVYFVISSAIGTLYLLTIRFISSLERGRLIFYSTLFCNLINILLLCAVYDALGFFSIPVSTIISQGLVLVFMIFYIFKGRKVDEK